MQVSNEYIYCKHEVGLPHILIGLITIAIYVVFIAFERSRGAPADAKWPDKMKAEGPPKILRALVNIVVAALLMLQPSPGKLAGSCVSAVALLSIGAVSTTGLQTIFTWNVMDEYSHGVVLQVLRGKADRSVMYTIEQNPVPLLSFFRSLCRKSDGK